MKRTLIHILKVYVFTWLFILGWFFIRGLSADLTIGQSFRQFQQLLSFKEFYIAVHILFAIFLILFLIFMYFRRIYKIRGLKTMVIRFFMRLVMPVALVVFSIQYILKRNTTDGFDYQWDHTVENQNGIPNSKFDIDGKFRGMSIFGLRNGTDEKINDLVRNNIEWVAIVPFMYQKDEETHDISTPEEIGKWSGRDSSYIKAVRSLHSKGLHVMLKPHLWVSSGWRSNLTLDSKMAWDNWFEGYRENMLHYTGIASELNIEMLCIGTELSTSVKEQPRQWKDLIKEIRSIYSGKLTYAANWDREFEAVEFWEDLDFIGIQAYFPLTENKNPNLDAIQSGWKNHLSKLEAFHKKYDKPILFTEVGYRSDASTTIRPWEWNSIKNLFINQRSAEAQMNAYEAMFSSLWYEDWFKGCFIWQWDFRTTRETARTSLDFSPRFKPAENTIAKWYGEVPKSKTIDWPNDEGNSN